MKRISQEITQYNKQYLFFLAMESVKTFLTPDLLVRHRFQQMKQIITCYNQFYNLLLKDEI